MMDDLKSIVLFGCKNTTSSILHTLLDLTSKTKYNITLITINPQMGHKNNVAGYFDLTPFCEKNGIDYYQASSYSLKTEQGEYFFSNIKCDLGFAMGWQRLIPSEILKRFNVGVFGMHGSADDLPFGRGRSPLNWALIERRHLFYTNLFKYNPGVDDGDVHSRFVFNIKETDTAETLHMKNLLAMKKLIRNCFFDLLHNPLNLTPQQNVEATYYPKRQPSDGIIDWQLDTYELDAFIRAVSRPFDGAFSYISGQIIYIYQVRIFDNDTVDYGFNSLVPGEIAEVFDYKFLVKCKGGLLLVEDYMFEGVINVGDIISSPQKLIKIFPRNFRGNFDC